MPRHGRFEAFSSEACPEADPGMDTGPPRLAGSADAGDVLMRAGKTHHQMPVMRDRFRPADQIALNLTAFPREERPLLLGLDALRKRPSLRMAWMMAPA